MTEDLVATGVLLSYGSGVNKQRHAADEVICVKCVLYLNVAGKWSEK